MAFTVHVPVAGGNCCVEDGKRIKRLHPIREIYIKSESEVKIYCWSGAVFTYPTENLKFFRDSGEAEAYVEKKIEWLPSREEELGYSVSLPAAPGTYCVQERYGYFTLHTIVAYWVISEHEIKIQCENEEYLTYHRDNLTFFENYEDAKNYCHR